MADPQSPLFRFQVWRAALPPALRLLLTLNVGLYVVWVVLMIFRLGGVFTYLALVASPDGVLARPWTPLTYTFANLYGGFFGLISFVFAMLWLTWMGRDYEETYGSHRLLGLYLMAGLIPALMLVGIVAAGVGGLAQGPFGGVYFGAWGPVTAVLCALATMQPNRGVGLFLLGVVPMKWIAIGFVVLDLAFVQDPTHLLAALFGFGFAKAQQGGLDLAGWAQPLFGEGSSPSRRPRSNSAAASTVRSWFTREEAEESQPRTASSPRRRPRRSAPADPANENISPARTRQAEVDRILDKILEHGFDSLTAEEKRILEDASGRA